MAWSRRLLNLLRSGRSSRDIDRELAFHLAERTDELVAAGMSETAAAREARRRFGNYALQKERTREADILAWLDSLAGDLRYAARALRATPVFTVVAVLSLALGLGANTALFSIVKTVLLEPLPYVEPAQLVTISQSPWTPSEIVLDLERSAHSFQEIAAYYPERFAVSGSEEPHELEGARVTDDFFRLFGAGMARGRDFVAADARAGAPRTAIISYGVWQRELGGAADVIGRTIRIDDEPHEIIGVVDRRFRQLAPRSDDPGIWIPLEVTPTDREGEMNWVIPIGRLGSQSSLLQAQAELDVVTRRFERMHPDAEGPREWRLQLARIKSELVRNARPALLVLQLAVGVVLLLACVNVANLLLARFSARQREVAMRSALGASTGRLLRQLLTESVLLAVMGGLSGLLLMQAGLKLILALAPADTPRLAEVSADSSVLLFALGASVATGLFFGVVPAMVTTRREAYDLLREGGRAPARSRRQHRLSQALVAVQVSLTLVLLVGAGLLGRSFISLATQPPGFRTSDVTSVRMHVPQARYTSVPRLDDYYQRTLERLRSIPGVESVALANNLPISRGHASREYQVEGETRGGVAQYGVVSPGYFRTLDIPLVKGRDFLGSDRRGAPGVAIIDEAMGRALWPHEDPLGKRFRFDGGNDSWLTVVGVVADTRGSGLASVPHQGFYIPYLQRPENRVELAVGHDAVLLVRSRLEAASLSRLLREGIWEVDPRQPLPEIATLESILSDGVSPQRFHAALLGIFAAIALILVVTGTYGVVAYLVAERTPEFGIRMAMGATGGDILARVLRWGMRLAGIGVLLGILGALVLNRYLASLLFGVTPADPPTVMAAAALVALVTLAACLVPAVRASRVDPVLALQPDRRVAGEARR